MDIDRPNLLGEYYIQFREIVSGHGFVKGWEINGQEYSFEDSVTPQEDIEIRAIWTPVLIDQYYTLSHMVSVDCKEKTNLKLYLAVYDPTGKMTWLDSRVLPSGKSYQTFNFLPDDVFQNAEEVRCYVVDSSFISQYPVTVLR